MRIYRMREKIACDVGDDSQPKNQIAHPAGEPTK